MLAIASDFPSTGVSCKIQPTHQPARMLIREILSGLCVVHRRFDDPVRASHVSVAASLNTVYTRRVVANSDDFRCADVLNRKTAYKCMKVVEQQVPF
jgi:hypothetical protein